MRTYLYAGIIVLSVLIAGVGCGGGETTETKSIGEIHESEGVPVAVRPVEPTGFSTHLSFIASLRGAAESTASAMVADEVAGILYKVGDYVEKESAVVLFPPDNPSLGYEQAQVSFESARTAYNRIKKLYEDDGVSRQAYDDARTRYELARAKWESVQRMTRVEAPISGYITRINVFESENVQPGTPLFTVSDFDRLNTIVWISDRDIDSVRVGQRATASWHGKHIVGEVVQVDMAMDQEKMAFAAKLEFDNPDLQVQSGVTADIEVETYRREDAVIVHQSEIVTIDGRPYVFREQNGRAVRTEVEVERREGLYRQISSGLSRGDRVITRGIELIEDGRRVRVVDEEPHLVQN
jgi:RND family efflux transporter MFP subunit